MSFEFLMTAFVLASAVVIKDVFLCIFGVCSFSSVNMLFVVLTCFVCTYNCVGYEEIWWAKPTTSEVSAASVPKLCELITVEVIFL